MSETMSIEVMGTIKADHVRSPLGEGWRVAVGGDEQILTDPQAAKDLLLGSLGLAADPAAGVEPPRARRPRRSHQVLKAELRELLAQGVPRDKAAARLRIKAARLEALLAELEAGGRKKAPAA